MAFCGKYIATIQHVLNIQYISLLPKYRVFHDLWTWLQEVIS